MDGYKIIDTIEIYGTVISKLHILAFAVAKVPSRRYRNSESRVPSTFYLW